VGEAYKNEKKNYFTIKSQNRAFYWSRVAIGIIIAGAAYILIFIVFALIGFTYDSTPGIPIIGNPKALMLYKITYATFPFLFTALYFHFVFMYRKHRVFDILTAVMFAWVAEKLVILGLSSMIYNIRMSDISLLLYRISQGGDQTAPWFTTDYVFISLLNCVILGLLASIRKKSINKNN
jgi:hypothetical protein